MATAELQISSYLSTLFQNKFELPNVCEAKNLISQKHGEKLPYDDGIDTLNDIVCSLLLQKKQFFSLQGAMGLGASETFSKKFSYEGELLDKNMILATIEVILKQDGLLSMDEVQSIVDHQKCVVLFNQTSNERLSDAFDFLYELFEFECGFENESSVISEQKKYINSVIKKSNDKSIIKKGFDEVDTSHMNMMYLNEYLKGRTYCYFDSDDYDYDCDC